MKRVIFDLDGTLVITQSLHRDSLRQSLHDLGFSTDYDEKTLEGLPTSSKLEIMQIDEKSRKSIWYRKQELTSALLHKHVGYDMEMVELFKRMKFDYSIACASNAISSFVFKSLQLLGVLEYFDIIYSNQYVSIPKPDPLMFNEIAKKLTGEEELYIFEDSRVGIQAARKIEQSTVVVVSGPEDTKIKIKEILL